VIDTTLPPILHHFQVIAELLVTGDWWLFHFNASASGSPANIRVNFTSPETRRIVLLDTEDRTIISSLI